MISSRQKMLIKRAQRQAGLEDAEYRDALAAVCGCTSCTDASFTDRDVDRSLAFFESIYWRKVDAGQLQAGSGSSAVFRQRGFWASRNTSASTTRDRFAASAALARISSLEQRLAGLGFGQAYCHSIRTKATAGEDSPAALNRYSAALLRTLRSKERAVAVTDKGR